MEDYLKSEIYGLFGVVTGSVLHGSSYIRREHEICAKSPLEPDKVISTVRPELDKKSQLETPTRTRYISTRTRQKSSSTRNLTRTLYFNTNPIRIRNSQARTRNEVKLILL